MDADYWRFSVKDEKKFNENVCRGFVYNSMKDVDKFIERFIRSTGSSFPDCFKFIDYRVVDAWEIYRRNVFDKEAKRKYDLAESDLFLIALRFEFHSRGDIHTIERFLWLPFVRPGNLQMIKGSMATLHAVLADRLMSVTDKGLFIIIQRAKFNLDKKDYTVLRDGEIYTNIVLEAFLHNDSSAKKPNEKWASPTTGHYLFAKYGVTDTFKRYYKTEVYLCTESDIDPRYDPDEHVLFKSRDRSGRRKLIRDVKYALVVPRDMVDDPGVMNLVLSFFYATDLYNDSFNFVDVDRPGDWVKTLGYAIFREKANLATQLTKVEKHLESLEDYIDEMTREVIQEEGLYDVNSIYDLLIYANDNVISLMKNTDVGSMWGKYLMSKRYSLSSITFKIINLSWELKKDKDNLTLKKVQWALGRHLHPYSYLGITKGHGEKTNEQYCGDNMLFKHTLIGVRQINAVVTPNGKPAINVNDPGYWFHHSIFDSGSVVNFAKHDPDGRLKFNPFITTTPEGKIEPNPDHYEMLLQCKDEISFG